MGLLKLPFTVGDFVLTLTKLATFTQWPLPLITILAICSSKVKRNTDVGGGGEQDVLNLKLKDEFYPTV